MMANMRAIFRAAAKLLLGPATAWQQHIEELCTKSAGQASCLTRLYDSVWKACRCAALSAGFAGARAALDAARQAAPAPAAPAAEQPNAWQRAVQGAQGACQRLMMWAPPATAGLAIVAMLQCMDMRNGASAPAGQPCLVCVAADLITASCFLANSSLPWGWMGILYWE